MRRRGRSGDGAERIRMSGTMKFGRLVLILLVLAAGFWLLTRSGMFSMKSAGPDAAAPTDRARTAAAAASSRAGETDAAPSQADAPSGPITENMSPDQVRALLGSPEEILTETTETGGSRERWLYRRVGKTVVFETASSSGSSRAFPTKRGLRMRHPLARRFALSSALLLAALPCLGAPPDGPPETKTDPVRETVHGVEITDPYRWLEDQEAPQTRAWIDEQNAYTREALLRLPGRADVQKRLAELLKVDAIGIAAGRRRRYFFSTARRRPGPAGPLRAPGGAGQGRGAPRPAPAVAPTTRSRSTCSTSPDGTARSPTASGRAAKTRCRQAASTSTPAATWRTRCPGPATPACRSPATAELFYSRRPKEGPRVFLHTMGTPATATSALRRRLRAREDHQHRALGRRPVPALVVFHGSAARKTEVYFQDLVKGDADAAGRQRRRRPVLPRPSAATACFSRPTGTRPTAASWPSTSPGPPARTGRRSCRRASSPSRTPPRRASGSSSATSRTSVPKIRIFDRDGKALGQIELTELGTVGSVTGDWDSREAFYSFQSYVVPPTIYRYDVGTGDRRSGRSSRSRSTASNYAVNQVWYPSKDGTRVPDVPRPSQGRPSRRHEPDAADRLRRLQRQLSCRRSPRARRSGSSRAASTRSPTCAAAASSARTGTRPGCSRRSRTSSTTSSPRPSG